MAPYTVIKILLLNNLNGMGLGFRNSSTFQHKHTTVFFSNFQCTGCVQFRGWVEQVFR